MFKRPVVHYRDLSTAGDKSFTWREGVRPGASRPSGDTENIRGKSINNSIELSHKVEESRIPNLPNLLSRYPSDKDKLRATSSEMELNPPRASMETVEDTNTHSPPTVITQPRRQIPLINGHWVPNRALQAGAVSATPSNHRRIFKSLATLTTSKSAPQPSQLVRGRGTSVNTPNLEPPEIPRDTSSHSFRIKGAGPWLAKHLPQKKLANPFHLDVPVLEAKKPPIPDPDENFEKFLRARAEVEEASHRPGRRRKHLGGIWECQRD
ncbi:hypothetical protein HOY82DRAFT_571222, partial [Tuber indicum]